MCHKINTQDRPICLERYTMRGFTNVLFPVLALDWILQFCLSAYPLFSQDIPEVAPAIVKSIKRTEYA
jgi:hypothetical protein